MQLEIVNVDVALGRKDSEFSPAWVRQLAASLPELDGERIIFLPPLLANVMSLPRALRGRSLRRATMAMLPLRPLRLASVFFAYPGIGRERLPWAVMHDRMERFLREDCGGLARETGSTVITSVLADHPRIHWEAWPERGDLYHSVQTIRPDGDPVAALRQRRPQTTFGETFDIDPEDSQPGYCVQAGERTIGVVWDGDSLSAPAFKEQPRIVWCPRASKEASVMEPSRLLRGSGATQLVVTTHACHAARQGGSTMLHRGQGGFHTIPSSQEVGPSLRFGRVRLEV